MFAPYHDDRCTRYDAPDDEQNETVANDNE